MRSRYWTPMLACFVLATGGFGSACGSGDEDTGARRDATGGLSGSAGSTGAGGLGAHAGGGNAGTDADIGGSAGADASVMDATADGGDTAADDPDSAVLDAESGLEDVDVDAPISALCGDGIRDPVTEECDDATGSTPADSCNSECRVQDVLVHTPTVDAGPLFARRLGNGRHPVAGGASGFAVATLRTQPDPNMISVRFFDPKGVPGTTLELPDNSLVDFSDPTLAALPGGKYAVAYTDLNQDGAQQGVAFRILDPATSTIGPIHRANTTTLLNQRAADMIWTGSELVIAWEDQSAILTQSTDTVLRRFSESGTPLGGEEPLGATTSGEGVPVVAEVNGTYAAIWLVSSGAGQLPNLIVRYGSVSWTVPFLFGNLVDEKPALLSLDGTHLLILFIDGTTSPNQHVRGAILDTTQPGTVSSFPLESLVEPYASDSTLWQRNVTAARVGDRVFVSWSSKSTGSSEGEELWLKELSWSSSAGTFTLDLSFEEIPLPRQAAHREGRQERPSLVLVPQPFENLLATAWVDFNVTFGPGEAQPDVSAELIPLPVLRLPDSDGGLAK